MLKPMKKKNIITCEKIRNQIDALYKELHPYALKKPHDPVNKFKIGLVNGVLNTINGLIGDENLPITGFRQFDDNNMPSMSDVSLVLDQYIHALEIFRSRNIELDGEDDYTWIYIIDEEETGNEDDYLVVKTAPPTAFR